MRLCSRRQVPVTSIPFLLLALAFNGVSIRAQDNQNPENEAKRWRFFSEEVEIDRLLLDLADRHRPQTIALEHADVLTMKGDELLKNHTVVVDGGLIQAIGPSSSLSIPEGAIRIDARGKYVLPGLTDMHVHILETHAHYLLNLVNGVTTVRDMGGYPWMITLRNRVRENRLLAPNIYLSGTILNGSSMGMYAVVVKSPIVARRLVREQSEAGYDFIKVHNVMAPDVYEAVMTEARRRRMDVVGHIPHDISLAKALELGQRTFEHFKGYYLDRTLELTGEDYVALTKGAEVWNCPTFYTYRIGLRGDDARKLRQTEEAKYLSSGERALWLKGAEDKENDGSRYRQGFELSKKIFRDLLAVGAKFVAGTDSGGGYPMMVPGFALHEELRIMVENGMSVREALRSATVNAAEAMRRSAEFGTIEARKRADLLLVSRNPLESIENVSALEGVMVRGIWLDRAALDSIKGRIREIYAEEASSVRQAVDGRDERRLENHPGKSDGRAVYSGKSDGRSDGRSEDSASQSVIGLESPTMEQELPTAEQMDALVAHMVELHARGFVFMEHQLSELERMLSKHGRATTAVARLRTGGGQP